MSRHIWRKLVLVTLGSLLIWETCLAAPNLSKEDNDCDNSLEGNGSEGIDCEEEANDGFKEKSLSGGTIAGIVVGIIALLIGFGVLACYLCTCCCCGLCSPRKSNNHGRVISVPPPPAVYHTSQRPAPPSIATTTLSVKEIDANQSGNRGTSDYQTLPESKNNSHSHDPPSYNEVVYNLTFSNASPNANASVLPSAPPDTLYINIQDTYRTKY